MNCNWVVIRWQWLFYMYTNMKKKKKVTSKFKSGGLHEKHAVATWKLGYHLSFRLYVDTGKPRKTCVELVCCKRPWIMYTSVEIHRTICQYCNFHCVIEPV